MHEFIILEASATDDAIACVELLAEMGGAYQNPPSQEVRRLHSKSKPIIAEKGSIAVFTIRKLATGDLKEHPEYVEYIRGSCRHPARWVYISGHSDRYGYFGENLPPGQGAAHFAFKQGKMLLNDGGAGKVAEEIDTSVPQGHCACVLLMGCATIGNQRHMSNLQRAFGGGDRPAILGWYEWCPSELSLKRGVLKGLFDRVKKALNGRDISLDDRDLLVRLWGEVAIKLHPSVGACDKDGQIWIVKESKGRNVWVIL